jgi:acetyltransferase-like isoleucine patch superfamily enzyme
MMNLIKYILRNILPKVERIAGISETKLLLKAWGNQVIIGNHTYGLPKIFSFGEGAKLIIGEYCSISDQVKIFLGGNHRYDWVTTYPFAAFLEKWPKASSIKGHPWSKGDVIIGNDVWIGYGATILSGIKIADGAVIGAQSVVSKNVEPYAIVAGNPARIIGKRFDDAIIERLLEVKWWEWPIDKIQANVNRLNSCDINSIISGD